MPCDHTCPHLAHDRGEGHVCQATNYSRECIVEQCREKLLEKGLDPDP